MPGSLFNVADRSIDRSATLNSEPGIEYPETAATISSSGATRVVRRRAGACLGQVRLVDCFKTAHEFRAALLDAIAGRSGESSELLTVFAPVAPAGDALTMAMPSPVASPSKSTPAINTDATFVTAIPPGMRSGGAPAPPSSLTFEDAAPTLVIPAVPVADVAATAKAAQPAATPPEMWGGTPTMVGVRLDDFTVGAEPTMLLPRACRAAAGRRRANNARACRDSTDGSRSHGSVGADRCGAERGLSPWHDARHGAEAVCSGRRHPWRAGARGSRSRGCRAQAASGNDATA